jgi:hypothetical protein
MTLHRETCVDLPAGAQATRPAAWAAPYKDHGATEAALLDRLRKSPVAWTRRPASMASLSQWGAHSGARPGSRAD